MLAHAACCCLFNIVINVERKNQFDEVEGAERARCKCNVRCDGSVNAVHLSNVSVEEVRLEVKRDLD